MQVFDKAVHLKFFQRRKNGLAVVVAGDGEDAQRRMRLLPIAQERGQTVEQELRLVNGKAQGSPRGRAGAQVSAENQGVGVSANRRSPAAR